METVNAIETAVVNVAKAVAAKGKAPKPVKVKEPKAPKAPKEPKAPKLKPVKVEAGITDATDFVAPKISFPIGKDWICQGVPCWVKRMDALSADLEPFNKSKTYSVSIDQLEGKFDCLRRDMEYVYAPGYPEGRIALSEFTVKAIIGKAELIRPFEEAYPAFVTLLDKAYQDSYTGKGNNACITIEAFNKYDAKNTAKLERIGDPVFNRNPRHTIPVPGSFSRADFEKCPSFPAPTGIRAEDFALPSEQNDILRDIVTQLFNCVNAPPCPPELQEKLQLVIVPNSHKCDWCGEKMDAAQANQTYSAKEHSINFCHRNPSVGTKKGNVYFGHCSCNREQGGHSEEERVMQVLRLAKSNPAMMALLMKGLQPL